MSKPSPTLLDRTVAAISPSKGLKRYAARLQFNALSGIARESGGNKGTMGNWLPRWLNKWSEGRSRAKSQGRARDLVANDPHAASVVDSMATNSVGTGLQLQPQPHAASLGWNQEQVDAFQADAEWIWQRWCREADARGKLPFWAMQLCCAHSMLTNGEYFVLPVMLQDGDRDFSLALQMVDPVRLSTPAGKESDPRIRDGVEMDQNGKPVAYWMANPAKENFITEINHGYGMDESYYARISARLGHRPGFFHSFLPKEPEQVRGVSVLSPAMKFFKDLSDYLDYELVGAIVASSIPVFIESQNPEEMFRNIREITEPSGEDEEKVYHQEVEPGQFLYGNTGEKPHVLKNDRPGNTFESFVERVLRAVGASVGMPYEVIAKDFSKTNYSSARAALLEAHRVYQVYQKWLVDGFCQPVWEMVLEEAFLRGMIPSLADMDVDTFYRRLPALAKARWIPPKRGHVDPLKEMNANLKGLENNIYTLSDVAAEHGTDWRSLLEQRAKELTYERDKELRSNEE